MSTTEAPDWRLHSSFPRTPYDPVVNLPLMPPRAAPGGHLVRLQPTSERVDEYSTLPLYLAGSPSAGLDAGRSKAAILVLARSVSLDGRTRAHPGWMRAPALLRVIDPERGGSSRRPTESARLDLLGGAR